MITLLFFRVVEIFQIYCQCLILFQILYDSLCYLAIVGVCYQFSFFLEWFLCSCSVLIKYLRSNYVIEDDTDLTYSWNADVYLNLFMNLMIWN